MSSRPTNYKLVASNRTAAVNAGMAKLDGYSGTNAAGNSMMDIIKKDVEKLETLHQ